ncbi:MAG TPA: aminopeptidase P N-terminal domain-containing protein [Salinivirga sp.]|uniref:aminopeptidase P N-terminal domain-containing protein n=1 Tax=Salinivirga sp. TaxID=1970192 RepID=UPI002B47FD8B|nr:aminopeptidase P N-terminal domain-containing protein [Salinivirga sp.]HKK59619.1 aminopeptidase P N-terminal domain-containing protein [Salinivirga sp.]
MRHQELPYQFFTRNRKNLQKELDPNTLVIVFSNPVSIRNGDQQYVYRQASDMFYFTGITQPETVLVMYTTGGNWHEILFINRPDSKTAIWDGYQLNTSDAADNSGITDVRYTDTMKQTLEKLAKKNKKIASTYPAHHQVAVKWTEYLMERNKKINQTSLQPIISKLRVIKSPEEIALIKKAIDITRKAFENLVPKIQSGAMEYEIEAEMIRTFIANGSDGHAFDPIVASGPSACILHYINNNRKMKNKELLLLDFGAEFNGYAADMSRTLPIGGQFTTRQKEVYQTVLDAQKEAIKLIRPGISIKDINEQVRQYLEKKMVELNLFTEQDIEQQNPKKPLSRKYFMHGTSHFMGIDVHDVGDTKEKLQPGMVLTCEPGLYIKEEALGVRIENDILVTENGNEDLMAHIPRETEDIEKMLRK